MEQQPLVSVVVITYNSSATIIETLESIKNQTYQNIELIVSDDYSKDNTIEITSEWLKKNSSRFEKSLLLRADHNAGTSANCNRGVRATSGLWFKLIAGDDCLLPDALTIYVDYVTRHEDIRYIVAKCKAIGNLKAADECRWFNSDNFFLGLSNTERKILLCYWNFVPAAATFINRNAFFEIGGFDESVSLIEDWPFWLKVIHSNHKIGYIPKYTVQYRFSDNSVSQPGKIFSERYLRDYELSKQIADSYIDRHNFFVRWHAKTYNKYNSLKSIWSKLLYCTNVLNPFLYVWLLMNSKIK